MGRYVKDSGGVWRSVAGIQAIDSTPTQGSANAVSSGGVHTAINSAISYVAFKGTTAQWTALSATEKAKYELVVLTDD